MLSQLVQRQVLIGNKVTFFLKNGHKVTGVLVEISCDHITLENEKGITTVLVEMIGAWEVPEDKALELEAETTSDTQPSEDNPTPDTNAQITEQPTGAQTAQSLSTENLELEAEATSDTQPSKDNPTPNTNAQITEQPTEAQTAQSLSTENLEPIFKKLIEIEARFHAQLQTAKIELEVPDFVFPADDISDRYKEQVATVWNIISNRYEYANKINELSSKFGRIQPITHDLESLVKRFSNSSNLKRHLAYFYFLLGEERKSMDYYKDAAKTSQEVDDWYNLASLALKSGEEELGCYALEQVFFQVPITEKPDAWYVYIKLLENTGNYPALVKLCEITERNLSEEELVFLLETGIYLLKSTGEEKIATSLTRGWMNSQALQPLALESFRQVDGQLSESYQRIVAEFSKADQEEKKKSELKILQQPQGYIYTYRKDRGFGFLEDLIGKKYFFHRSAIIDDTLLDRINNLDLGEQIPAVFETAEGPKGPLALRVALLRTVDELFNIATDCAEEGDYARAIGYIRQVLDRDSEYPEAQDLYEKWREYVRATGVPKGSNPYARAKRIGLIEKDLDNAARLFRQAISQGDNTESAIKDLAHLLVQQGNPKQAIEFLQENRGIVQDQQSVDNMLIVFYQNANQYNQAIALLRKKLDHASGKEKEAQVLWQIANCYLRQENYDQAKQTFEEVLDLHPDNLAARRNIAICHFKQQQFDEAERILNNILDTSPNAKAAELLEAITRAKATGESTQIDEIIIDTTLSDFSGELSEFTQFFLKRCEFQGVPPDRVRAQAFDPSDIKKLEEVASQFGTRRPRDRAGYYLSAAKITSILEDESSNQFYRYLCRSFASSGDATIAEGKPLDAARELYCEALSVYGKDRSIRSDEQDAVNALVRFLFSTLGQTQVPLTPHIPPIDETVEQVLSRHPQQDRVFDAIAYLVFRSRYAANRILKRLHARSSLQVMALEYLDNQGISVARSVRQFDDFVRLWNELLRRKFDEWRAISSEFRFLTRVGLTTASLEAGIERLKSVNYRLFFNLDQERARQLQTIFETTLDLVKQVSFEEQERLCIQVNSRCDDLLREIEGSPTKLSVEELCPVVEAIQNKVEEYLEELYISSMPQLELRLPMESYVPDNNQQIEVQIVVANKIGRSPAESLELIVQEDENLFTVNKPEIKLDESLRGSEQRILELPIRVTHQALQSQTFSLPMYAQYCTRSGETKQTQIHNFSILLYPEEEFETIDNPYVEYAEAGIVEDPMMFYGRDELIDNITNAIQKSRSQSKSIVVFGQKRSGKSSILHHVKKKLEEIGNLLILDLGNIGSILDEQSSASLLYQILWSILRKLEYAIEDMVEDKGLNPLDLTFPSDREFYSHPSPLVLFKDIFDRYRRKASKTEAWQNLQIVLLIDEFSYIYGQIVRGRIPELFMKNWKALLQENYFSVVLAGQDVMTKFKQRFPNEFGTTQDERANYLKRADAAKLIDEPIRIGGRQGESRYRERAIDLIIDLTAGSPFYIQIICDRLVKHMNNRHTKFATDAHVEQVKNELIRGVNALSQDKFDNLINSGDTSEDAISDEDALKVLKAIAVNSQTGPCNRNSITCETHTPVDVILDDLVNRDVIERERERYYQIRVGLFKDWLIAHQ
ncbi:tetratricopeptide repeat protein [bacterium]|nr:tetratricopeptide repeat protein [bacterium]